MDTPLKILIIEDSAADFQLLERHLAKNGLNAACYRVTDRAQLQAALTANDWNLVLSDYNVPNLSFPDTIELLRPRLDELPLILVSGSVGEERAVELLKLGVWDFVLKENLARLLPAIQRGLRDAADRQARRQAEAALRESEEKFRQLAAIVESSDDAIIGKDLNGMILHWNRGAERVFGYTAAEITGTPIIRLIPKRFQAEENFILGRLRSGQRVEHFETRRLTRDGREIDVSVTVSPIRDAAGAIVGASKVVRDITERKAAEAALRESEGRFRLLFEGSLDAIFTSDPVSMKFTSGNPAALKMFGFKSEADMLAWGPADLSPERQPDGRLSRERAREIDAIVLREGSCSFEWLHRRLGGGEFYADVLLTRVEWRGQLTIISTVRDITERRKAGEERQRLNTALEQAAESIVITDLEGMMLYVNPAFEKITGYSRREAIGQNVRILNSGKLEAAFFKNVWETLTRGEVWHGHFINKRKDGSLFEEDATISPVRDASGRIVNYVAIKLDVTREVELQAQFRQAQKIEAIGQLAGGVAHDFNNILTSVLMQVALGHMEQTLPDSIRECLEQIQSDAERAASLTRQLLLFSRRQVMQSRDLDLNDVVTNLAKMLQRIIGEDVRLQLNLHSLPLMTHADAGMLDQVLMNLAVNSRDAMPRGGRLLITTAEQTVDDEQARRQPDAQPGRYVSLRVTDTGAGIPADVLPRIFEPFFTTKETGKGTGLGLATVFGIVKHHRGWITVGTEPGRGTTFEVFLPAANVPPAAEVAVRERPHGGTETILLVEDEAIVRHSLRIILTRNGYNVLEAATGDDALRVWAEHRPRVNLLLTDLVMPGSLTGLRLARQLKADQPGLKVIFTSGYSSETAGREIQLEPGEAFLQKPLMPDELLRVARNCLDGVM
jgi:PAS domain S-box-containing protein